MRELLNSEVNLVSGAGVVTNNEVGGQGHYQISLLPSFGLISDPTRDVFYSRGIIGIDDMFKRD